MCFGQTLQLILLQNQRREFGKNFITSTNIVNRTQPFEFGAKNPD
jgi:hypothetical protein